MLRAPTLGALGTLLISSGLAAQICAGAASFEGRPIQLFGEGTFNNSAKSFVGSVRIGGKGAFGDLELGTTHVDAFNASSFDIGGGVAYQVKLDPKGSVQLCPAASVGFLIGPKNIQGTGIDYSETALAFGLGIGVLASRTEQIDIMPTASVVFENADAKLKDQTGATTSNSQSFGVIEFGLGFVFSKQVTLKPIVAIPVGLTGGNTSFSVALGISLGGSHAN